VQAAQEIDRQRCREFALGRSWEAATRQFLHYLEPIPVGEDPKGASAHPGQ